jgi:hypothetical protein
MNYFPKSTNLSESLFLTPVRHRMLQRECACGGAAASSGECAECRNKGLQRKAAALHSANQTNAADPLIVQEVLRSPSQPLDAATRAFFEPRFGHDFSQVRVHADSRAAQSSRALRAQAFTVGNDIVFAAGQLAPHSEPGRLLLAHELTHVVQQSGSATIHRQTDPAAPTPPPAAEAEPAPQADGPGDAEVIPEGVIQDVQGDYQSQCVASAHQDAGEKQDAGQQQNAGGKVARKADGAPGGYLSFVVPPDHASEREADAVSKAVVFSPTNAVPAALRRISPMQRGAIQRKILWDQHPTLSWADFTGTPDRGSTFDASTNSGLSESTKVQTESFPLNPDSPCTSRGATDKRVTSTVSLDISPRNLHAQAFMEPAQSWVKPGKQTDDLLDHEQGHFDISHVIAGKLDFALMYWGIQNLGKGEGCGKREAENVATRDWNAKHPTTALTAIIRRGLALQTQAQHAYDDQTQHGAVPDKQKEWKMNIVADLPDYDIK